MCKGPEQNRGEQETPNSGMDSTGSTGHRPETGGEAEPIAFSVLQRRSWWNRDVLNARITCKCGRQMTVECPMKLASFGVQCLQCFACNAQFQHAGDAMEVFADDFLEELARLGESN
jgi:hypothetical protein